MNRCLKVTPVIGFDCEFMADFSIQDYLGRGKSVPRGFGAVKKLGAQVPRKQGLKQPFLRSQQRIVQLREQVPRKQGLKHKGHM
jgi:hypothetical protein